MATHALSVARLLAAIVMTQVDPDKHSNFFTTVHYGAKEEQGELGTEIRTYVGETEVWGSIDVIHGVAIRLSYT